MHHFFEQLARRLASEHFEEIAANRIFTLIGGINPHPVMTEAIPVTDDRRKQRQHTLGRRLLLSKGMFRLKVAKNGAARTHHIHRMRFSRDQFQCLFKFFG
ncbi:Uncharacterised protein [Vibrio cholerae]|nr:Uncharacterised protein [Vibrio cholerae]